MDRDLKSLRMAISMKEIITMESFMAWVRFKLYRSVYLGEFIKILRVV